MNSRLAKSDQHAADLVAGGVALLRRVDDSARSGVGPKTQRSNRAVCGRQSSAMEPVAGFFCVFSPARVRKREGTRATLPSAEHTTIRASLSIFWLHISKSACAGHGTVCHGMRVFQRTCSPSCLERQAVGVTWRESPSTATAGRRCSGSGVLLAQSTCGCKMTTCV